MMIASEILSLLLIGLVLLGAVALTALLVWHRQTRVIGIVILAIGLVLVLMLTVAAGVISYWRAARQNEHQKAASAEAESHNNLGVALAAEGKSIEAIEQYREAIKPVEKAAAEPAGEKGPPPAPRPSWVDAAACRVGDAYQMSIVVGPYATRLECDAQLPEALQGALDAYVETYLGREAAGRVRLPPPDLRTQLVKDEWEETIRASFGPMKQLHVLLQFDHKIRDRIKEERDNAVIAGRLVYTAGGVAGGLLLLAILFAFLKLDQATGGTRRGRLGLAALVAAAGVTAGICFLVYGLVGP